MRHSVPLLLIGAVLLAPAWAPAQERLPGVAAADPLYDVAIVGKHVWIAGYPGILLHSTDGGETFAPMGKPGIAAHFAVDFVDEKTGWVAGRGGLVQATRDGGATWVVQSTGSKEPLLALDFFDASNGMAVGNFATSLRTTDGGATWTPVRVAPEGEDPSLNGVAMISATEAVVVGEYGGIYRTADGGATWEKVESGVSDNLYGVAVVGGGAVLAVGADGSMTASTDGGKTFAAVDSGTKQHLFRVAAAGTRVLATGNGGTVLSADGVQGPWAAWKAPTYFWVGGAAVGADGRGFVVGGRSLVLRTADGGRTWKQWGAR